MNTTGHRVTHPKPALDNAYDAGHKSNGGNAGKGGKGQGITIRSATKRPKDSELARVEMVARLGRAYDAARGDPAAILAVAADAEAAGLVDLARVYRREAAEQR